MTDLATPARTDVRPAVEQVADTFVELMQTFVKARSRLMAAAQHDVEWSAHILLKAVHQHDGPMRAGALADAVQSDPSTVSRQIAALVKDGLLERHADPQDGRAALLVVTDRGRQVLADQHHARLEHYARMLAGWTDDELAGFAAQLHRFTEDYDQINDHWLTERVSRGTTARSGGHD